jgi:hypothetical protein
MRLKISSIEVPEDQPFKNDKLSRTQSAEAIAQILSFMDEPLVLALCSPWGTGKTTFLKMLRLKLEADGFRTISLNAWESDFSEDATIAILSEMERGLQNLRTRTHPNRVASEALKQLGKAGLALLKTAVPFGVRLASSGLLATVPNLQGPVTDFLSKLVEDQIEAHKIGPETVFTFKKKLSEALVTEGVVSGKKPLVVLVDELDRCRPTYSIQFLEVIRHFFNIPQVAFILAIDESQLHSSISAVYGQELMAAEYLRKFIDLKYYLPQVTSDEYIDNLFARYDFTPYFKQRSEKIPAFQGEQNEFRQVSKWYFSIFSVSLRAQEQLLTHLSLILRTTQFNMILLPSVLLLLMLLHEFDRKQYVDVIDRRRPARQIIGDLVQRSSKSDVERDRVNLSYIEALLAASMSSAAEAEKIYSEFANNQDNSKADRDKASDIVRMLGHIEMNYHVGNALDYFSKKIELLDPFIHKE